MKLEVGMYVRSFEGNIFKIQGLKDELIYVSNTECHFYKSLYGGDYCFRFPNENNHYTIIKASHNIIDLIEPKDIVVGIDGHKFEVYAVGSDCVYINGLEEFIYEHEIKSIITKEQFESMSYKVGE